MEKIDLDHLAGELAGLNPVQQRLLTPSQVITLQPPAPLIEGIISQDSFSVIYGPPASGKSFIAIDWAMSIGGGLHWQGREVRGGPTLYVAAEGERGIGKRIRAWLQVTQPTEEPQTWLHPAPVNLLDESAVNDLAETARDLKTVLVVIDTLHRSLVGGDENSSVDMGKAIDAMMKIQSAGTAVVVVHHTNKMGEVRGHSSLLGSVDHMVETWKAEDSTIWVKNRKSKDDEPFRTFPLWLHPVQLPYGSSCVVSGSRWDG